MGLASMTKTWLQEEEEELVALTQLPPPLGFSVLQQGTAWARPS